MNGLECPQEVKMKKILVLGVGAQGSTTVQRLDEEPSVEQIICADYDEKAVSDIVKITKKTKGLKVDGNSVPDIVKAAQGVDLLVNALPVEFGKNALDAAIEAKTNYQDFALNTAMTEDSSEWVEGAKIMFQEYRKRFAEIGKTALIGTGSAPGLMCVLSRRLMQELDACETINMFVYEGAEAKRFQPFWWSAKVALSDMSYEAFAFENGEFIRTEPFTRPLKRKFPELGGMEVELIEHAHEEPIQMGLNAKEFFKGAKNIYFKYGGVGVNFCRPLSRAGLLSMEEKIINGKSVVPFDVILAHLPQAPKTREEIQEIIDEGMALDIGAFVAEAFGQKDGKNILVEGHVTAPGFVDSFNRSGLTGEMYLTGQCGFLFTKMFIEGKFNQRGLISSDMLTDEQVNYYLDCAAKLDITLAVTHSNWDK